MFKLYQIIALIFVVTGLFGLGLFQTTTFANGSISDPISSPVDPTETPTPTPTPTPEGCISCPVEPTPAPTQAPSQNNDNNSNNNSGNNSGGSSEPAPCTDTKPGSAPIITSGIKKGANQVTVNWNKAVAPVTHYVLLYGVKPGVYLYGNSNVGSAQTTSYTVGHLAGNQTYYFRLRAVNNCTPSDYSNEVSTKATGAKLSSPATGFTPTVLGTKAVKRELSASAQPNPTVAPKSDVNEQPKQNGILNSIQGIFGKLFGSK